MSTVSPPNVTINGRLQEKMVALKQEEKRVKMLMKLLRSAKRKRDQLKAELSYYQRSVAPSPIKKLPDELFLIIFKHYLVENRKLVRRLLLVSKRWYNLVVHHPQMWNVINLNVPKREWDVFSWAYSAEKFISKCLARSQSAPLHVRLDLASLQTIPEQVMDRIISSFPNGTQDYDLIHWLSSLNYQALENDAMIVDCFPVHAFTLLETLIGDGKEMERWETVEVFLPEAGRLLASRIWEILSHPLPKLSYLHLYNLDHLDGMRREEIFSRTPDFSNVKYLRIDRMHNWDLLSFFTSSLEELFIEIYNTQPLPADLSRFTQLRTLSVKMWFCDSMERVHLDGTVQITLPCLQELSLWGRFKHLGRTEFKLPVLKTLNLGWERGNCAERELPVMQPLQVKWSPMRRDGAPARTKAALRRTLQHFTGSETLSVPSLERETLFELLSELSGEGVIPPAWKFITLHHEGEMVEYIDIHGLLTIP